MYKLNHLAAALSGVLLILAPTSFAANYNSSASTPIPSSSNYKGEEAVRPGNYKGEAKPLPTPPPKPRLVMAPIILQEGPYLGAAAGYDSYKVQENFQFAGTTVGTFNPTINATGLVGGLLAGYGHYFNTALYLGFEGFINTSDAYQSTTYNISDITDNINYNSKFFVTMGYGASLLPGIKLSDSSLFFVRLGYQVARLRGQENIEDTSTLIVSNTSSWSGGLCYGLGFEEAMVENFSLRGDFIHTDYRAFTATSGTEYSPSNNQFLLALIYHLS